MESEGSLPCSQKHANGPYPKPDEFSPHILPPPISLTFILIWSSHLRLDLPNDLFNSNFRQKFCMHFLSYIYLDKSTKVDLNINLRG
jgi:hypothetical protein